MESDTSRKQAVSSPLKVALIGYGKMGKAVEAVLQQRGHAVISTNSVHDHADICIDFSAPDAVVNNVRSAAEAGKSIVVGTTGWYDQLDAVTQIVNSNKSGLLYSPNFSIGVQLFLSLVAEAAQLFDPFTDYDVGGYEMHHSQKLDMPSGTAQQICRQIQQNMTHKKEISFPSVRTGHIPGTHTVLFDSPVDTITLTHTARSREGFARGAVAAAEWLCGRKGVFTLEQMLQQERKR